MYAALHCYRHRQMTAIEEAVVAANMTKGGIKERYKLTQLESRPKHFHFLFFSSHCHNKKLLLLRRRAIEDAAEPAAGEAVRLHALLEQAHDLVRLLFIPPRCHLV